MTDDSEDESVLKHEIADAPSRLPGVELPVAVAEEVRVPRVGAADVVVVDADGEITIVECKRAKNPEIRRWVIGQVFSYAAGLWKFDAEEFERRLADRGTRLTEPFEHDAGWNEVQFRSAISRNLEKGRFRLIIAVDRITEELKRTVVFLNTHTLPDVELLAIELRAGEDGPGTVHGKDSGEVGPPRRRIPRRRRRLLEEIRDRHGDAAADVAERVLEWAARRPMQLDIRDAEASSSIDIRRGTLVRIARYEELQVLPHTLSFDGNPSAGAGIDELVNDLAEVGLRMERGKARASLESLADKTKCTDFLALMDRVLKG